MNDPHPASPSPLADQAARCLRCGRVLPLDDDGFCDACRKALEEACL